MSPNMQSGISRLDFHLSVPHAQIRVAAEIYTSERDGNDESGTGTEDQPFKTVLQVGNSNRPNEIWHINVRSWESGKERHGTDLVGLSKPQLNSFPVEGEKYLSGQFVFSWGWGASTFLWVLLVFGFAVSRLRRHFCQCCRL